MIKTMNKSSNSSSRRRKRIGRKRKKKRKMKRRRRGRMRKREIEKKRQKISYPFAILVCSSFSLSRRFLRCVSHSSTLSIAKVSSPTTSCSTCNTEMCPGMRKVRLCESKNKGWSYQNKKRINKTEEKRRIRRKLDVLISLE